MEIRLVMKTARSVSLELDDGGIYKTKEVYRILVNGDEVKTTDTVITSLYGLKPDTDYEIGVEDAHEPDRERLHSARITSSSHSMCASSVRRGRCVRMTPRLSRQRSWHARLRAVC